MPKVWSDKDERLYKHVKQSEEKSGKTKSRAEEIAARTVNKRRATENRTLEQSSEVPHALEKRSVEQLLDRAAELSITGRSSMKKGQLIKAIRQRN